MTQLVFLNQATHALLRLPQSMRQPVYGRVSHLYREFTGQTRFTAEQLSERLFAADVPSPSGCDITIAFTTTERAFVVMAVVPRAKLRLTALESKALVVSAVDVSKFGLTVTTLLDEIETPAQLEEAVELYSQETDPGYLLGIDTEAYRFDVLQRLTQTYGRRWAASERR